MEIEEHDQVGEALNAVQGGSILLEDLYLSMDPFVPALSDLTVAEDGPYYPHGLQLDSPVSHVTPVGLVAQAVTSLDAVLLRIAH